MAEYGRNGGTHATQATALGDRGAHGGSAGRPGIGLRVGLPGGARGPPAGARTGTVTLGPVLPGVNRIIPISRPEGVLA